MSDMRYIERALRGPFYIENVFMIGNVLNDELIKLRKAFEALSKEECGVLKSYPNGCCGYVSHLVGTYLKESFFGEFDYIEAHKNGSLASHAWIMSKSGLIVDLTVDQFGLEPIICCMQEHPLSDFFPIQANKGSASIYDGSKLDNQYYLEYGKMLKILNN